MTRRKKDPLRPLSAEEHQELTRISRSTHIPVVAHDSR